MFKLVVLLAFAAVALLASPAVAKPQLVVDYGYYAAAPAYVASYSAPLSYSYPYPYTYTYPLTYF